MVEAFVDPYVLLRAYLLLAKPVNVREKCLALLDQIEAERTQLNLFGAESTPDIDTLKADVAAAAGELGDVGADPPPTKKRAR